MSKLTCKFKQRGWGKPKFLLYLVFGFLVFFTVIFLLRNILLKPLIEYVAAPQQVKIDCLSVDVNWRMDLIVNDLCLTTPSVTLTLQDAIWDRTDKQLTIQKLALKHKIQPQSQQQDPDNVSIDIIKLPSNLPTIRIKKITIESPWLVNTLAFSLTLQHANKMTLQGDINAQLTIQNQQINASVVWSAFDLVRFSPAAEKWLQQSPAVLNDAILKAFTVNSEINFDGSVIRSQHLIDFNQPIHLSACQIGLSLVGTATVSVSQLLSAQKIEANLSGLNMGFDMSGCESRPQLMQQWQVDNFNLSVPQTVELVATELHIPVVRLSEVNPDSHSVFNVQLKNFSWFFPRQFSSDYYFEVKQNLPEHSNLTGQLSLLSAGSINGILDEFGDFKRSLWQLAGSQNQLKLRSYTDSNTSFETADLDFTFAGDHTSGLTGHGELKLKNTALDKLLVSDLNNQFTFHIDPLLAFNFGINVSLNDIQTESLNIAKMDGHLKLSGAYKSLTELDFLTQFNALSLTGNMQVNQINYADISVAKGASQFWLKGKQISDLSFGIEHQFNSIKTTQTNLAKFNGSLSGMLRNLKQLEFNGQSNLSAINLTLDTKKLKVEPLLIKHRVANNFTLHSSSSQHDVLLASQLIGQVSQQQGDVVLKLDLPNVQVVQKLIAQLMPELELTQGQITGVLHTKLNDDFTEFSAQGRIDVLDVAGHYANTLFEGVNLNSPFDLNSAGLQLKETTLQIRSVNAGVPIEKIDGSLASEEGGFKVEKIEGQILGGQFTLQNFWLDEREQIFNLVLQDLDLEKIVALQNQPGIQIKGKIMGTIPLQTQSNGINVENGKLVSQNGGQLTIKHNPAFDTIKQQQAKIAFLEDYKFSQLSSNVSFKPNGWLFLDLAFVGENPLKKQAVNFNYSHKENIFALMQTLRVANGIQDKIEKNITQGGKK